MEVTITWQMPTSKGHLSSTLTLKVSASPLKSAAYPPCFSSVSLVMCGWGWRGGECFLWAAAAAAAAATATGGGGRGESAAAPPSRASAASTALSCSGSMPLPGVTNVYFKTLQPLFSESFILSWNAHHVLYKQQYYNLQIFYSAFPFLFPSTLAFPLSCHQ